MRLAALRGGRYFPDPFDDGDAVDDGGEGEDAKEGVVDVGHEGEEEARQDESERHGELVVVLRAREEVGRDGVERESGGSRLSLPETLPKAFEPARLEQGDDIGRGRARGGGE